MSSAHFEDFAPTVDNPADEFGVLMSGPGRWAVLVEDGGQLLGVLWTDDRDNLGLIGTDLTDPDYQAAAWAEIRRAKANGYTATETFDELVRVYEPDTAGSGDLADLLDAF